MNNILSTTHVKLQEVYAKTENAKMLKVLDDELYSKLLAKKN